MKIPSGGGTTCGAEGTSPLGIGGTYNTLVEVTCGIVAFLRFECCCECKRSNPADNKTSLCKGGLRWVFYLSLHSGFGNIFILPLILRNLNKTPSLALSWICSTLTEFRQSCYATKGSICSLSGLVLLRPSANSLPLGEGKMLYPLAP